MPQRTLTVSVVPSSDLVRKLGAELTELTARVLRKKPELTAVVIEQVPKQGWASGRATLDRGTPLESLRNGNDVLITGDLDEHQHEKYQPGERLRLEAHVACSLPVRAPDH